MSEEKKEAERIKIPSWLTPAIVTGLVAVFSMIFESHNKSIAVERDLIYFQKSLDDTIDRQKKIRTELDTMKETNAVFHEQALKGINELVDLSRKKERRK